MRFIAGSQILVTVGGMSLRVNYSDTRVWREVSAACIAHPVFKSPADLLPSQTSWRRRGSRFDPIFNGVK